MMDGQADIAIVEETSVDRESPQMIYFAKLAAQTLTNAYPNHLWAVGWAPGMALVVKHMLGDQKYGFTIDVPNCHSISHFEHTVRMAGGELLERLGYARGAWNGDLPTHNYDGVRKQDEMDLSLPGGASHGA